MTQQQGDLMLCLAQGCAQGRQLGACLFQTHTRLVDIELGHQTGLVTPDGQLIRLGLCQQIAGDHGQTCRRRTVLHIVESDLSQQRNGHVTQRLFGGLQRCLDRFHGTTLTAKEIDLPARIEPVAISGVAIRITAKAVL